MRASIISSMLLLSLVIVGNYQNCTKLGFEALGSGEDVGADGGDKPGLSGNGEWYQGVVYMEMGPDNCPDNDPRRTAISYYAMKHSFWLLRRDCKEIIPEPVSIAEVAMASDMMTITFQGYMDLHLEMSEAVHIATLFNPGQASFEKPSGYHAFKVECWGAGGSGGTGGADGFGGGGGGSGGYSAEVYSSLMLDNLTPVSVGIGGNAVPQGNGIDGQSTFFGNNLLEATGGSAGQSAIAGGRGGLGGSGNMANGGDGQAGDGSPGGIVGRGGDGGASPLIDPSTAGAGGVHGGATTGNPGMAGSSPGGGGGGSGGGGAGGGTSGAGGNGQCTITGFS